jgi:pimeloyl-ACP methyl ester carboxylesterase
VRFTSVLLVEQVHDFLQILWRQTRVDGRRLDVGVAQMLLHRTEVSAGTLEQFDAARMTERRRVDRIHAAALAGLPDREVREIKDGSHMLVLEHPEEVAALIRNCISARWHN